jgi:hypothetical protein
VVYCDTCRRHWALVSSGRKCWHQSIPEGYLDELHLADTDWGEKETPEDFNFDMDDLA